MAHDAAGGVGSVEQSGSARKRLSATSLLVDRERDPVGVPIAPSVAGRYTREVLGVRAAA